MTLVGLLLAFVSLVAGAAYLARAGIRQDPASCYEEPWNDTELAELTWNQLEPVNDPQITQAAPHVTPCECDWGRSIDFDIRVITALSNMPDAIIGADLHTTLALAGDNEEILGLQAEALRTIGH